MDIQDLKDLDLSETASESGCDVVLKAVRDPENPQNPISQVQVRVCSVQSLNFAFELKSIDDILDEMNEVVGHVEGIKVEDCVSSGGSDYDNPSGTVAYYTPGFKLSSKDYSGQRGFNQASLSHNSDQRVIGLASRADRTQTEESYGASIKSSA